MWYLHRKGGGRQSPERHRSIKNRAIRDAQINKMFVVPRRAHAHFTQEGRRRLAHRARGYVFRRDDPLWKDAERRAGRCAREPESTRDPKTHAQRGNETNFPFAFLEKSVDIGGHEDEANWHEWPERSDSRSDR